MNFLRDLKADFEDLSRTYFPNTDLSRLDEASKQQIINEIQADFDAGFEGIQNFQLKLNLVFTLLTFITRNYK